MKNKKEKMFRIGQFLSDEKLGGNGYQSKRWYLSLADAINSQRDVVRNWGSKPCRLVNIKTLPISKMNQEMIDSFPDFKAEWLKHQPKPVAKVKTTRVRKPVVYKYVPDTDIIDLSLSMKGWDIVKTVVVLPRASQLKEALKKGECPNVLTFELSHLERFSDEKTKWRVLFEQDILTHPGLKLTYVGKPGSFKYHPYTEFSKKYPQLSKGIVGGRRHFGDTVLLSGVDMWDLEWTEKFGEIPMAKDISNNTKEDDGFRFNG